MNNALQTIQLLVAPVVMISACGLLCLALYNRLAAIVSRARAFHKERFDARERLLEAGGDESAAAFKLSLAGRTDLLEDQVHQILARGRMVRSSLMLLLTTILCMLVCSLALGLSLLAPVFATVALLLFLAGVVAAIAAIVLAILELRRSLDPVLLEHLALGGDE